MVPYNNVVTITSFGCDMVPYNNVINDKLYYSFRVVLIEECWVVVLQQLQYSFLECSVVKTTLILLF
jgi:hypothetical protein